MLKRAAPPPRQFTRLVWDLGSQLPIVGAGKLPHDLPQRADPEWPFVQRRRALLVEGEVPKCDALAHFLGKKEQEIVSTKVRNRVVSDA
jgi:hypothetical protein